MNARGFCPVVLEEIEVRPTRFIQCDDLTIDYRVVREISESLEDQGILTIEGISPSGNRFSLPPDFTAMARYPSNLTSNTQSGPVGSVGTARHSMGSLNVAEHSGREFSVRSVRFPHTVRVLSPPSPPFSLPFCQV